MFSVSSIFEPFQMFSLLEAREQELAMIRDGKLTAKHNRRPTKKTRNEAFDKYLKIFYDRPKIEVRLTFNHS